MTSACSQATAAKSSETSFEKRRGVFGRDLVFPPGYWAFPDWLWLPPAQVRHFSFLFFHRLQVGQRWRSGFWGSWEARLRFRYGRRAASISMAYAMSFCKLSPLEALR